MTKQPRKHHYVPRFFLGGFTDDGTAEGILNVVDTVRRRKWTSKPCDAAHRRDFYAIDGGQGADPMTIEKKLGLLEDRWSAVLRNVIEQQQLPSDDPFGDLMMFIAVMAVRVPRIRERTSTFIDEVKQTEEVANRWLEQHGHPLQSEDDHGSGGIDQTWYIQQMIQMAAVLAPLLGLRTWQLWIADPTAPDLICSDSPVSLNWATAVTGPYPPGFGLRNTVVSIPLHKRVAMVGMLETDVGRRTIGKFEVAQLNSATGMHASQLYCPKSDLVWLMKDGSTGDRDDLLETLKATDYSTGHP